VSVLRKLGGWLKSAWKWIALALALALSVFAPLWYLERRRRKRETARADIAERAAAVHRAAAEIERTTAHDQRLIAADLAEQRDELRRTAARLRLEREEERKRIADLDLDELADEWNKSDEHGL
jgi:hypothetical protein